jgi:hypothetical protein
MIYVWEMDVGVILNLGYGKVLVGVHIGEQARGRFRA